VHHYDSVTDYSVYWRFGVHRTLI